MLAGTHSKELKDFVIQDYRVTCIMATEWLQLEDFLTREDFQLLSYTTMQILSLGHSHLESLTSVYIQNRK